MSKIVLGLILVFVILSVGLLCASQDKSAQAFEKAKSLCESAVEDVSMIQLISNPEKFHGKCVRFIGFMNLEFEGDAIYIHEDDYTYRLTRNGLWLSLTDTFRENTIHELIELNRRYVIVEGIFNAKDHGHGDLFSGALENIQRFEPWVVKRPAWQK